MSANHDTAVMDRPHAAGAGDAWVSLAFAANRAEAEACTSILAECGIPARIVCETRQPAQVALAIPSGVELLVPSEFEMQAAELVAGRLSEQTPVCDDGADDEDDFVFDEEEDDDFDDDDEDDADDEFDDLDDDDDDDDEDLDDDDDL